MSKVRSKRKLEICTGAGEQGKEESSLFPKFLCCEGKVDLQQLQGKSHFLVLMSVH